MFIKITGGDRRIAFDGILSKEYPDGSVHEVSDGLGAALIRDKWATKTEAPKPAETKVVKPAETKTE